MKHWKPWEFLFSENVEDKEDMLDMLNLKHDHPFPSPEEHYEDMRHDKPNRRPSAGVHPED